MSYYYINDNFCKAQGINSNLDWLVINYFCEPVDDDKDWVIAISLLIYWNWQTHDKIYW